jgi:hypothetical protein
LQQDFFEGDSDRFNLTADPQHTNIFVNLAAKITDEYVFGSLRTPLKVWDWSRARSSRQLASKDSFGGFFFSQVLNNNSQRNFVCPRTFWKAWANEDPSSLSCKRTCQ